MAEENRYSQPRAWWDPLLVGLVGVFSYAFLSLWSYTVLSPSVWSDVVVAAGLRPPDTPFPGLYRLIVSGIFAILSPSAALDIIPHVGRAMISCTAMLMYVVLRDLLPATLKMKVHLARIGAMVGRLSALTGALLLLCCDPVWRAGQTFTPVTLFLLMSVVAVSLFFTFLRKGSIKALYSCCAVLGFVSAESTVGFLLALVVAVSVVVAVRWARDPDIPLVNPLVDELVREIVFKRLTYIWAACFAFAVAINVCQFIACDGLKATGIEGVPALLFEYFRGAYDATRSAASGSGWLFIFLFSVAPFVLAVKLLPRAWDDDKFLPWVVGVVYCVIGVVALTQLSGARVLWFWTWLGTKRLMIASDMLLSCALVFDVIVVAFSLAVFGVDAICRNYRRIAQQQYPESMLEAVPAMMAQNLGKSRILRKHVFWTILTLIPIFVIPGRFLAAEREMGECIHETVRELLRETQGCEAIFTDGSLDHLIELEALRDGRKLVLLSMMSKNTPLARMIRQRIAKDEEDKTLLESDAASAMREWLHSKEERLNKCAVELGFEMWRRAKKKLPPLSGLVALPGGISDEERKRALEACIRLGDKAYAVASEHDIEAITDADLRRKFPFVLWRLSRIAHMRSRAADESGDRVTATHEAARSHELDTVNPKAAKLQNDMNWSKKQNGGLLSPREGLIIGLNRADFALAGKFAAPVLAADPYDPRANFAVGMMHIQEQQFTRAEYYLLRCLKRRPDEPAVLNNLAIAQTKLGKYDEAEKNVRRAIEKYPHISELQKTLDNIIKARHK